MANEATSGQGSTVERLGRYELLGEIASGGMATVYLGRVTGAKGFQRLVAIKRLHPHLEGEEEFVSMFLDEARLAAKIRHPNVVGTLDVEDDEHLYLVMEYVEGDRLLALLRHSAKSGEKIPPAVAVRISMDTLAGLHAAHELTDDDGSPLGLVHRDVSPQNILISVDGSIKLVDFGIAKASARLSVTRDGQLKGKIAYMAPEQTKRSEIDRRVDVFAMGIITWEMLTAKKLFNGESDVEVLNQLLFEPIPRLREVAPTVPASLDSVVSRALERDPAKRFSTAAEFADALERASKIFGGPATTKTIAAHLQKVSGEKIAKDRARILAGAPPVPNDGATPSGVKRRATGQFSVPTLTNPGAPIPPAPAPGAAQPPPVRKATMVGLGGNVPPPPPARPSAPTFDAGPSLLDDDEDVPTAAIVRADVTKSLAAVMAPPKPAPSAIVAGEDLIDDEPTAFEPAVGMPEPTSTTRDAVGGGASMLSPTASPRAMTQQLPAVRPAVGAAPVAATPIGGAPLPAPTAGVSIETPFEVPAPRVEQPKSKAGLIAGAAALFLLLGGGGAVAYVKLGQQTDTTISSPRTVTAGNGASDNSGAGANAPNTNPATTPNGAGAGSTGTPANTVTGVGPANTNPTAGTPTTNTGTQNTAGAAPNGAAPNGAVVNPAGAGANPAGAAANTAGAAGTAPGTPVATNTGTQNGTPSAPANGTGATAATAQGATNTGTQNGTTAAGANNAGAANGTSATSTPSTPTNGTRTGGRRTGGRRTGGRTGGNQGGGEDLFGGTPY